MDVIKDSYVTNVKVKTNEIENIRLFYGNKKSLFNWYLELGKPNILMNASLFNTNGTPIESFQYDGNCISKSDWCDEGFGINWNGTVQFGKYSPYYRDFTCGFPMIVQNCMGNGDFSTFSSLANRNPRSVFSQTDDGIMLTTIDGRQTNKLGMTLVELRNYMLSQNVIHSANLDGGGSTRLLVNGEVINSPCEDRPVPCVIAIWLKGDDNKMKICIDAGHNHSKYDTGAEGNELREQDITFEIARQAGELLKSAGFDIKFTRNNLTDNIGTNLSTSLSLRASTANSWGADLFLSIHCNAFANSSASGTECYVYSVNNKIYPLAAKINNAIVKSLGTTDRGVLAKPELAVLRQTNMPAILIETAFISNKTDADKLLNKKQDFARAIATEICNHYGKTLKPPTSQNTAQNKYSYDDTVDNMIKDGITTTENMAYWEKVLDGREKVDLNNLEVTTETLTIILKRKCLLSSNER